MKQNIYISVQFCTKKSDKKWDYKLNKPVKKLLKSLNVFFTRNIHIFMDNLRLNDSIKDKPSIANV